MPGKHSNDEKVRGRGRLIAAGVVLVVVAAAGVVGVRAFANDRNPSCDTTSTTTVAADPTIAPILTTLLQQAPAVDRGCIDFEVTAQKSADTATVIAGPATAVHPDLWLPDSSLWLLRTLRSTGSLPALATSSVASTVPVVIGRPDAPPAFANWLDVLRTPGLRLGDPLTDSPANSAILSALAESEISASDPNAVSEALVPLAQAFGLPENDKHESQDLVDRTVDGGGLAVVTEQAVLAQNPPIDLVAEVPQSGAYFLNYPLAVTAPAGPDYDAAADAGGVLAGILATDVAQKALSDNGFRGSNAIALPGRGVGDVTALQLQDPTAIESTLRDWAVLALPLRTLVLEDVSGSMAEPFANSTRMALTVDASLTANAMFNDRTQMGMWAFSTKIGPNQEDYRELVPLQGVKETWNGQPQRDAILDAVRSLPSLISGDTGLYDSTLAAFRQVKEGYDPNYVNSIIVMTDGANEDPGSISLDDLVATLERETDAVRPVVIVTVGITSDADQSALQRIAAATGGTSWVAQDPRDISGIFTEALNARKSRLGN